MGETIQPGDLVSARQALILLLPAGALGHPGALNAEGCHVVRQPFQYADGRIVRQGEYHCHRPLDTLRLEGREALKEPEEDAQGREFPERSDVAEEPARP